MLGPVCSRPEHQTVEPDDPGGVGEDRDSSVPFTGKSQGDRRVNVEESPDPTPKPETGE